MGLKSSDRERLDKTALTMYSARIAEIRQQVGGIQPIPTGLGVYVLLEVSREDVGIEPRPGFRDYMEGETSDKELERIMDACKYYASFYFNDI